jgi:hypothetical protein
MIFKIRNTHLRSDGTNFFVRYIPQVSSSSSSSSIGSSSSSSAGSSSSSGQITTILACGFGSFPDGQFSIAGTYNGYDYYTLIDGATTWYLYYDLSNTRYAISNMLNGSTYYWNTTNYIYNDWTVSYGSVPGGDTYDYDLTSQCPQSSSSSSSQGSSTSGPNNILACGFGSFNDGQFASAGYYNDYEYYTLVDGATTWYLYYDNTQYVISVSLGGTIYYYASSYVYNDWIPSSGVSPGGDTYDYSVTSQCPQTSSSGSGNTEGPTSILACNFGAFGDVQFLSAGYYNNYEYYSYYDGATTWYLWYDLINNASYIDPTLGNTSTNSYNLSGSVYIGGLWNAYYGSPNGGTTYDYSITSVCPQSSSSSGSSVSGPSSILACGFGSISDGQFTVAGYYNNHEYYSYYDMNNATTWYLYYDSGNSNYAISTALGSTAYYTGIGYLTSGWTVGIGNSPGGDTYDYTTTSNCLP